MCFGPLALSVLTALENYLDSDVAYTADVLPEPVSVWRMGEMGVRYLVPNYLLSQYHYTEV